MTDDLEQARRQAAMVRTIMEAVSAPDPDATPEVGGQMFLNAFHCIAAAMLESLPQLRTGSEMRDAADGQAKILLGDMKTLRTKFEKSGIHAWDVMNPLPPHRAH